MKQHLILVCVLLLGIVFLLSSCKGGDYRKKLYVNAEGDTLRYRLLKPVQIEKKELYPLIIFLHGSGERGNDNQKQLIHGTWLFQQKDNLAEYPAYVMAPQCPEGERWVEAPWDKKTLRMPDEPSKSLSLVMEMMDILINTYPIDTERIYVTGLSMGGYGTWDLICRHPERFAAAVPICGGGDTGCAEFIKDIPLWAFHSADDPVVPVEQTRNIIAAIRSVGGNPNYTEYTHAGHGSWKPAYEEPELMPWLFAQKRK